MQCEEWIIKQQKQKQGDQFESYCNGEVENEDGLDNSDRYGKSGPILEIF